MYKIRHFLEYFRKAGHFCLAFFVSACAPERLEIANTPIPYQLVVDTPKMRLLAVDSAKVSDTIQHLSAAFFAQKTLIANPCLLEFQKCGKCWIIIREFKEKDSQNSYYWAVAEDLQSYFLDKNSGIFPAPISWQEIHKKYPQNAYLQALSQAEKLAIPEQNAGFKSLSFPPKKGFALSLDLCPSVEPLEKEFFHFLDTLIRKNSDEKPIPITFFVSGGWIRAHRKELGWLLEQEALGKFAFLWANHSNKHAYSHEKPDKENFLRLAGTDLAAEILRTEETMLKNGLLPSVFFRFPGLVSDTALYAQVLEYGYLPIGTNAWIAKGQKIRAGAIALLHGNGNEPKGVRDFVRLYPKLKDSVQIVGLREGFVR